MATIWQIEGKIYLNTKETEKNMDKTHKDISVALRVNTGVAYSEKEIACFLRDGHIDVDYEDETHYIFNHVSELLANLSPYVQSYELYVSGEVPCDYYLYTLDENGEIMVTDGRIVYTDRDCFYELSDETRMTLVETLELVREGNPKVEELLDMLS